MNRFSTGEHANVIPFPVGVALVLLFCCLSAKAEDTKVHLTDYAAYASIATYRTLDYTSTRYGLSLGGHEDILPSFVVKNLPVFAAFEGLATAGEISGSVYLIHHGHRKLARFTNAVSIGVGSFMVARNYSYGRTK